jgi:hypothetical protein
MTLCAKTGRTDANGSAQRQPGGRAGQSAIERHGSRVAAAKHHTNALTYVRVVPAGKHRS